MMSYGQSSRVAVYILTPEPKGLQYVTMIALISTLSKRLHHSGGYSIFIDLGQVVLACDVDVIEYEWKD